MNEYKDTDLVHQCLSGKPEVFEVLVDKYQKAIFNVAYRMTKNYHDAEDITQSVFIKAYEKLNTFNPKFKFFSWIYRIAVNDTLNFVNQKRRIQELNTNIVSREKTPEEFYDVSELSDSIQDALLVIGLEYQVLIILKHFQQFTYKEIAYIVDIPEKKVKSRLFSARQMLRDVLIQKGITSND